MYIICIYYVRMDHGIYLYMVSNRAKRLLPFGGMLRCGPGPVRPVRERPDDSHGGSALSARTLPRERVSSSHTSSCPHTRHTCANYNISLYICTFGRRYQYICTIILNIIMRSYSRLRNSPRPSRPPPISRVADLAIWRALSLCPCGNFKEILQPSKGGPVRFSETFCGRNG